MARTYPPSFLALLHQQRGIFTGAQAAAHGVSADVVRAQVRAERWRYLGRSTFAAFTGPLHDRHRSWYAVLAAGAAACLSHESAAHVHGLLAAPPVEVHVLIPADRRIAPIAGAVVHRSRVERQVHGRPPATAIGDTLCDLAENGWRADRLAGVVAGAIQRGLLSVESLNRTLTDRGQFRGVADLRALVEDTGEGAHSALEIRYLRHVERRHGLPRAARQSRAVRGGRTTFRDVHYAPYRVTVELDGRRFHEGFHERLRDQRRDRLAADAGELTLRYAWRDVAAAPCLVAQEVAGALAARGWTGGMRPCPSCGA